VRQIEEECDLIFTLLEGRDARTASFVLEKRDSGRCGHTITYRAEPGAELIPFEKIGTYTDEFRKGD